MSLDLQKAPPTPAVPDDRATEFTAVDGGEHYAGSTLLVEAYAAIWLVMMAWIFLLWRKQATLGERLDGLERTIDRAAAELEKKAPSSASAKA
jgi:hypothetical protein